MTSPKHLLPLFFACLTLAGAGCAPKQTPPYSLVGVSLSPQSYDAAGFTAFLPLAKQAGNALSWAGGWQELETPDSAPWATLELAKQNDQTPIIIIGLDSLADDPAERTRLEGALINFVKTKHPPFLVIGVEHNFKNKAPSPAFDQYVTLFASLAQTVKQSSPQTQVMPALQYEWLLGRQGGLFGGKEDLAKNQWDLLSRFPDADLIAFTTYPNLVFHDPEEIPEDYYAQIKTHTDKPIAFIETGWPSATFAPTWDSTDQEQARFVNLFFRLTDPLSPRIRLWSFLFDQKIKPPFNTMGMFTGTGEARPSWPAWTAR
jgi:hypothetical protein